MITLSERNSLYLAVIAVIVATIAIGMTFTKTEKTELIQEHQTHEGDTGSSEVQIALLTGRLNYLTDHFKSHAKEY